MKMKKIGRSLLFPARRCCRAIAGGAAELPRHALWHGSTDAPPDMA
jgi:hypothetical protein